MRWVFTVIGLTVALGGACSFRIDSQEPPAASAAVEAESSPLEEAPFRLSGDVLDRYLQFQRDAAKVWKASADSLDGARTKSRLSESQLDELDQLVDQFLALRDRLAELPQMGQIEKLRPKTGRLPEVLREKIRRILETAADERKEAESLSALRSQIGEAAVELLLVKESDLRAVRKEVVDSLLAGGVGR